MNSNLTEIISLHDSTAQVKQYFDEALEGYRAFIKSQKTVPGSTRITHIAFSNDSQIIHNNEDVQKIVISKREFKPDGVSAINDAIANSIISIGQRYAATPEEERPSKVIFIVSVFGRDNASKNYTYENVRDLISMQHYIYKWDFILLTDFSINMEKMGIDENRTIILKRAEPKFFHNAFQELIEMVMDIRGVKKEVKPVTPTASKIATGATTKSNCTTDKKVGNDVKSPADAKTETITTA